MNAKLDVLAVGALAGRLLWQRVFASVFLPRCLSNVLATGFSAPNPQHVQPLTCVFCSELSHIIAFVSAKYESQEKRLSPGLNASRDAGPWSFFTAVARKFHVAEKGVDETLHAELLRPASKDRLVSVHYFHQSRDDGINHAWHIKL